MQVATLKENHADTTRAAEQYYLSRFAKQQMEVSSTTFTAVVYFVDLHALRKEQLVFAQQWHRKFAHSNHKLPRAAVNSPLTMLATVRQVRSSRGGESM
jgi:hypothetical protein